MSKASEMIAKHQITITTQSGQDCLKSFTIADSPGDFAWCKAHKGEIIAQIHSQETAARIQHQVEATEMSHMTEVRVSTMWGDGSSTQLIDDRRALDEQFAEIVQRLDESVTVEAVRMAYEQAINPPHYDKMTPEQEAVMVRVQAIQDDEMAC